MEPVLAVKDLQVAFSDDKGRSISVDRISFQVNPGEVVCLVGESGCGKSVTSLAVMGLLGRGGSASGSARFLGKELLGLPEKELDQIRGNSLTMIFQDPLSALNPVFPIGRQIMESMEAHTSLSRREREEARGRASEKGGAGRYFFYYGEVSPSALRRPAPAGYDRYGAGLRAKASHCGRAYHSPGCDHPGADYGASSQAAGGDRDGHSFDHPTIWGVVAQMADRVLVMYAGQIIEQAPVFDLFDRPAHPYTRALMAAMPTVGRGREHVLSSIRGTVPERYDQMTGCRFGPRCPYRTERCGEPQIDREFDTAGRGPEEQNRLVRCCRAEEITADAG